jgi:hypothetical protein
MIGSRKQKVIIMRLDANCASGKTLPITSLVSFRSNVLRNISRLFLQFHEQEIPKIHKLIDLLVLAKEVDPSLEILRSDLEVLERYAVRVRYPGTTAEKEDAQAAFSAVKVVRELMRQKLELSAGG